MASIVAGAAGASIVTSIWLLLSEEFVLGAVAGVMSASLAVMVFCGRAQPASVAVNGVKQPVKAAASERPATVEIANAPVVQGPSPTIVDDAMIKRVHLADRVAWLTAIADLRAGLAEQAQISMRLSETASGTGFFAPKVAKLMRDDAGSITVEFEEAAGDDEAVSPPQIDSENADVAGKAALAAVSHELRTPLNAIIGFADLLRGEGTASLSVPRQREYAELIHEAGNHLLGVVNAMLDVSKIEAGHYTIRREAFDLGDTIAEAVSLIELRAEKKGLHLNLHTERVTSLAQADRRATKQILLNLLSNAVKFTPEQGCVTVDAVCDEGGLLLVVADTGIGMSDEDLARIGKPFQQADNAYTRSAEGTGLGLSLTRGLVVLHGGTMEIESREQVGTKVTVRIPAAENTSADASRSGAPIVAMDTYRRENRGREDKGADHASRRFG